MKNSNKKAENARMIKYLRIYDTIPQQLKTFYDEEEFVADISKVWGLQKIYEATKWPPVWPFSSIGKVPGLGEYIEWAKSEGATDENITWWWNLAPIDRVIIRGMDHASRRWALADFTHKGFKPDEVMKKIMSSFTIYTEDKPDISTMAAGDKEIAVSENRLLPIELHDRIDIYLKSHSNPNDLPIMKKEMDGFSSANAWVRNLITNGRI